ncbi:MAG: tetratricopeptide repeat protein [Bryobacterales bacterium]|nr:tetratricopeptide repeat protein [Bryobacterales bacterium]
MKRASLFLMAMTPALMAQAPAVVETNSLVAADTATVATTPKPAVPITDEMRGDIYMARKMYREAVEIYRKAGSSAVLVNKIGIAYHQMLELDQAQRHYEKAIKMNATYSEAINNLGTIYYAKKSYRKAVNQYKKALKVNPNSASIHSNLGTAYFARKKYKDAFVSYQKALELDPEVFEHRGTNGVLLQERSVQERAKFHFYLAKTYAKAGQVDRALQYMRKAIEEGFKERNKFMEDSEFTPLRELPEFQQLLTMEVRVL